MSGDERIAELTELARRKYGPTARVVLEDWHGEFFDLRVTSDELIVDIGDVIRLDIPSISTSDLPSALDALKAALLVLLYPKQATWALEPDPFAWVERLAAEWETKPPSNPLGGRQQRAWDKGYFDACCDKAAELRARAKGQR